MTEPESDPLPDLTDKQARKVRAIPPVRNLIRKRTSVAPFELEHEALERAVGHKLPLIPPGHRSNKRGLRVIAGGRSPAKLDDPGTPFSD